MAHSSTCPRKSRPGPRLCARPGVLVFLVTESTGIALSGIFGQLIPALTSSRCWLAIRQTALFHSIMGRLVPALKSSWFFAGSIGGALLVHPRAAKCLHWRTFGLQAIFQRCPSHYIQEQLNACNDKLPVCKSSCLSHDTLGQPYLQQSSFRAISDILGNVFSVNQIIYVRPKI